MSFFAKYVWLFKNRNFNALNVSCKNVIIAGRRKCCGMVDRTVVANRYRKTKKQVCGIEDQIVVVQGRRPSPALNTGCNMSIRIFDSKLNNKQFVTLNFEPLFLTQFLEIFLFSCLKLETSDCNFFWKFKRLRKLQNSCHGFRGHISVKIKTLNIN